MVNYHTQESIYQKLPPHLQYQDKDKDTHTHTHLFKPLHTEQQKCPQTIEFNSQNLNEMQDTWHIQILVQN